VTGLALRVGWYRLRATFGRRRGGYLTLVLLIGLVGGTAMASVGAARRTQSSFPVFLASTNPSDLVVTLSVQVATTTSVAQSKQLATDMAHVAGVSHVERFVALNGAPLGPDGAPRLDTISQIGRYGSVDGVFFDQDRLTAVMGRLADPTKADELVMTPDAAKILAVHVGQVVPWGFLADAQANGPGGPGGPNGPGGPGGPGSADQSGPRLVRTTLRLVGLVKSHDAIVQDDVDRLPAAAVFTPTFTRSLPPDGALGRPSFTYYGLQLAHGRRDVAAVEQRLLPLVPPNGGFNFHVTSLVEAKAERAVKPESIALGVFGGIAAVVALLIAAQVIARQLRVGEEDLQTLRALGASPATTAVEGLIGLLGAVVLGSLLAGTVATALSPLAPLGPTRPVYPASGIAADWTVLGIGMAALVVGLGTVAVVLSYWRAPHRVARRSEPAVGRAAVVGTTAALHLPAPALVGVRFALEPGRGRTAVPVRSALFGAALSVVMVVATLTFGSSLRTLVSHPALYGWNWSYILNGNPWVPPQARTLLDHDPRVAAWTGLNTANAALFDGQNVPILLGQPRAPLAPPVLSGHGLEADNQVVLGAATLARLHKHLGDTVVASLGGSADGPFGAVPPTRLVIVGTATMPALGQPIADQDHTSMATGALVSLAFFPPALQQELQGADPTLSGPGLVLVRIRSGVPAAEAQADLQHIADAANRAMAALPNGEGTGNDISVQSVQHPAEIVNYRSLGTTPAVLDAGLAGGAIVALGLTLASSVRRRRRDLALLKTFGFTTRQLSATVAWQASVAAVIGVVLGVPIGIALGRWLWILFARNISAVPSPTVPVVAVILVGAGALLLANLVASLPGRIAARTPTALLLRTE
jgi:hypothetical protein